MRRATKSINSAEELRDWALIKGQIGQQLKKYYRAYTVEELPPELLALLKNLDKEPELSGEQKPEVKE
jgi:hypothetical protein